MVDQCPICGGNVAIVREQVELKIRSHSAMATLESVHCTSCGGEFVEPASFDAAQKEAAATIRRELELLTPEEIKQIRRAAGLTQAQMEKKLRVGARTWGRWERGSVFQSSSIDRAIRVFAKAPHMFDDDVPAISKSGAFSVGEFQEGIVVDWENTSVITAAPGELVITEVDPRWADAA